MGGERERWRPAPCFIPGRRRSISYTRRSPVLIQVTHAPVITLFRTHFNFLEKELLLRGKDIEHLHLLIIALIGVIPLEP